MDRLTLESNFFQFCDSPSSFYGCGIRKEDFTQLPELYEAFDKYVEDNDAMPPFTYLQQIDGKLKLSEYIIPFKEAVNNLLEKVTVERIEKISDQYSFDLEKQSTGKAVSIFLDNIEQVSLDISNRKGTYSGLDLASNLDNHFSAENITNWGLEYPFPTCKASNIRVSGGNFCVVFAPTGIGKTWLLLELFKNWVLQGYSGTFFTYEMSEREVSQRLYFLILQHVNREENLGYSYTWNDMLNPDIVLSPEFKEVMSWAVSRVSGNMMIRRPTESTDLGFRDIKSVIQKRESHFYMIDGLYLVDGNKEYEWQVFDNTVKGLKNLAGKYDIPIIATNQEAKLKGKNKDLEYNELVGGSGSGSTMNVAFGETVPRNVDQLLYLGRIVRNEQEMPRVRYLMFEKLRSNRPPPTPLTLTFDIDNGNIGEQIGNIQI